MAVTTVGRVPHLGPAGLTEGNVGRHLGGERRCRGALVDEEGRGAEARNLPALEGSDAGEGRRFGAQAALEGSRLVLRELPVAVHCPTCDEDRELPGVQSFRCPVCATPTNDLRQGRELALEALEIESEEHTDDGVELPPGPTRESAPALEPRPEGPP